MFVLAVFFADRKCGDHHFCGCYNVQGKNYDIFHLSFLLLWNRLSKTGCVDLQAEKVLGTSRLLTKNNTTKTMLEEQDMHLGATTVYF